MPAHPSADRSADPSASARPDPSDLVSGAFPSPVHRIDDERIASAAVTLWLKRDDLVHGSVPGNKLRKLTYNLAAARAAGHRRVLAFGGAYSNLLRAVAVLGRTAGLATIGVVRGERHDPPNWSLRCCLEHGMRLEYVTRQQYRRKRDPEFLAALTARFGRAYLLPEGASNPLAVRGCAELVAELDAQGVRPDVLACSVGTGGTLAGLVRGLDGRARALGFAALKGGDFLHAEVAALLAASGGTGLTNWRIETGFHFGGYARRTAELDDFLTWFAAIHGVNLDPVYEGKLLFGLYALLAAGTFAPGTSIVAVLAGGPAPAEPPPTPL